MPQSNSEQVTNRPFNIEVNAIFTGYVEECPEGQMLFERGQYIRILGERGEGYAAMAIDSQGRWTGTELDTVFANEIIVVPWRFNAYRST